MDFRGRVRKRVWKLTFFGLKLGQGLKNLAAHPHQEHASYLSLRQSASCNSRTGLELISQFLCESELVSADIFSNICAQTCEISFLVLNIS